MKGHMSLTAFLGAIFISILSGFYARQDALIATTRSTQATSCKAIVFDLGGVLIETSKHGTAWQIGMQNLFHYWRQSNNSDEENLRKKLYKTLHKITDTFDNQWHIKDEDGNELPQLVAEWLRGMRPNKEILDQAVEWISQNPKWFSNNAEKKIIQNTFEIMFTPEKFVRTRKIVPETARLIKECKKRGFKLFVLSNWDAQSGKMLVEKYSDTFTLFDGIIFSGDVHYAKPEKEMFACITDTIPAHECVLVDDQPENIAKAAELGFHTILVNSKKKLFGNQPNIQEVKAKLEKISLLAQEPEKLYA